MTSADITHGDAPLTVDAQPIHACVDALATALHEYVATATGVRSEFGAADADGDPRLLELEHIVGACNAKLFDELHNRLGVHPDLTCSVWTDNDSDDDQPGLKLAEQFYLGLLVAEPADHCRITTDGVVDLLDEAGAMVTNRLAENGFDIVEWTVTRGVPELLSRRRLMAHEPVDAPVRLVLASASPARLKTLRGAGVEPVVVVSDVDEDALMAEATARFGPLDASDAALLLARAKAEAVADRIDDDVIVIGCDSIFEQDGKQWGKPGSPEAAISRLRAMSGRTGVLHTGHWIIDLRDADGAGTGATLGASSAAAVTIGEMDDAEIRAYVATGEPLAVAGSFTIDGLGGPYIERIEGDPHGVVGISLPLVRNLLTQIGVPWRALRAA